MRRVSNGVPVCLIRCPYTLFEKDAFDHFADKIEALDTLPPFSADWISLKTMVSVISLDPQLLVLAVPSLPLKMQIQRGSWFLCCSSALQGSNRKRRSFLLFPGQPVALRRKQLAVELDACTASVTNLWDLDLYHRQPSIGKPVLSLFLQQELQF